MDSWPASAPIRPTHPVCHNYSNFQQLQVLFHEQFGRMVFNFHSGWHLSVCRDCNLWSGSGGRGWGVEGLAWRQAAADRGFPFSPSWFRGCDITSVALLLRVMSLCLSGCREGTIAIKGSPTYRKKRGKNWPLYLSTISEMQELLIYCCNTRRNWREHKLHLLFLKQSTMRSSQYWSVLLSCASASPTRAWTVCPMNVNLRRRSPMDAPTISLWVFVDICLVYIPAVCLKWLSFFLFIFPSFCLRSWMDW